ncbi:MAG: hypothetical protein HQK79_10740 [Desulfobacterales bacterium]|nr:hypothetical protein [Desulfobacterales bacterium]
MAISCDSTFTNINMFNQPVNFKNGIGKGVQIKNFKPYSDFVFKSLVKKAEIINGEAMLPTDGHPVVAIVSHGPGFSWIPLPALAMKFFLNNGFGDVIAGMFPHKAMFLIPGLKNYYKKVLGAPTEIVTVEDIINLLKNNEIGFIGTAPEGANCLLSYDEYVVPFRSKGLIAAAIKTDASICLIAHQGGETWNKTINLPFGWTVPFSNGLKGFNITFPPYKKINNYIALCKRYTPSITSSELLGMPKREARLMLNVEIERIRAQMNLMTDEVKYLLKNEKIS